MRRKRFLALLICVAVFIVGIGIATGVDQSFGKVAVQDIYFTSNVDGALLHGRLYLPDNATAETPAPAVVFAQGNDADGEKYDIRLWAFLPIAADLNGMVCTENVQYMLYRKKSSADKEYAEQIDDDFIRIERGNRAAYEEEQEKTLF